MLEVFYIVLLVVFGALATVTFFSATVRSVPYKEELVRLLERQEKLNEQVQTMRRQLRNLELDMSILTDEKQALQEQVNCMRRVEDAHLTSRIAQQAEEAEI
jgi:TolA-binding protein